MLDKDKKYKIAAGVLAFSLALAPSQVLALDNLHRQLEDTRSNLNSIDQSIDEMDRNIDSINNNLQSSTNERTSVNAVLEELAGQKLSIEDQIFDLSARIQASMDKIYQLEVQITEVTEKIEEAELEIEVLKERIEKNTDLLRERIRKSYKLGDAQKIEVLMTAGDINDFLSRNKMITTIAEYDKDLIESLKADQAKLDALVLELNGNKTALEIAKANLEAEKEALEVQRQAQAQLLEQVKEEESANYQVLDKLNSQIDEYQAYLDEQLSQKNQLASQRQAANAEIADIERKINEEKDRLEQERLERERQALLKKQREEAEARKRAEEAARREEERKRQTNNPSPTPSPVPVVSVPSSGQLAWPSAATTITSYYGTRDNLYDAYGRCISCFGFHQAIDIAGPLGTAIYAADSGIVSRAEYHWSYGNYIDITHGNGIVTRYAHLSSLGVSLGQRVQRGQYISPMGTTGSSTGSHLHFEVRINGSPVNPLPYIR